MTIPVADDFSVRRRMGDLQALYDSSKAPQQLKKGLNALNLPTPNVAVDRSPYASDVRAVQVTKDQPGCDKEVVTSHVRFGMVATAGAISPWHFDPHGQGTYVRLACGMKLWAIASVKDPKDAASTKLWSDPELDIRNLDLNKYRVEMVLLRAGDTLLQESGALHTVLTIEDSICHGGHFLTVSCLKQIVLAAVHSYFEGRVATNTRNESFWGRLNALACFMYRAFVLGIADEEDAVHLPDLTSEEGLYAFLLFACLMEVQHVICPETYEVTTDDAILAGLSFQGMGPAEALELCDVSAVSHSVRVQRVYSRGRMEETVKAVSTQMGVFYEDGTTVDVWHDLYVPMQAWFICALKDYYKRSALINIDDSLFDHGDSNASGEGSADPHLNFPPPKDLFERQLEWSTEKWDELRSAVQALEGQNKDVDNLLWTPPTVRIQELRRAEQVEASTSSQLFVKGLRCGDTLYFHAYPNLTRLDKIITRRSRTADLGSGPRDAKRRKVS